MEDTAEQRVDGAELGTRLSAVCGRHDDARATPIESPRLPTVGGAVEHVIDRFRAITAAAARAALKETVDEARARVLGEPMPGIDAAGGGPALVVTDEVRGVRPRGHGDAHIGPAVEVVVGDVDVVLGRGRRVAIHEQPRLVGVVVAHAVRLLGRSGNREPTP